MFPQNICSNITIKHIVETDVGIECEHFQIENVFVKQICGMQSQSNNNINGDKVIVYVSENSMGEHCICVKDKIKIESNDEHEFLVNNIEHNCYGSKVMRHWKLIAN